MKLLALDTSSVACSAVLQFDDAVFERHEIKPREHTRLLMPMINAVLQEGDARLAELDAIVLGNGPGSFIGLRIAASVAQGLAFGAGIGIVPVSSLAAVAAEVFGTSDADEVVVVQDAHMNEVYLGHYRRGDGNMPVDVEPERLHGVAALGSLAENAAPERIAAGYGWQRYPELAALNEALFTGFSDVQFPRARFLLGLGAAKLEAGGAIAPDQVTPAYLRQKVAQKPAKTP